MEDICTVYELLAALTKYVSRNTYIRLSLSQGRAPTIDMNGTPVSLQPHSCPPAYLACMYTSHK